MTSKQFPAERVLLGMIMRFPENLGRALASRVTPASFGNAVHQQIFASMLQAEKDRRSFDLSALGVVLPEHLQLLIEMNEEAPVSQDVELYAQEVLAGMWARVALSGLRDVARVIQGRKAFDSLDVLRTGASAVLNAIGDGPVHTKSTFKSAADVLEAWLPEAEKRIKEYREGKPTGIPTGLRLVDKALAGGWKKGGFYTLGARTGRGKTTLGINFAVSAARAGFGVCYFTVEMPATEIMTKFLSNVSGIQGAKLAVGAVTDHEMDEVFDATSTLARAPIFIDDEWRGNLEAFKASCRRLKRTSNLDLVVLDYVGLVSIDGKQHLAKHNLVAEITMQVKQLAMELGISVLALSQLNREAEKGGEGEAPSTHHISDSDKVGADSDAVLLIYRKNEKTYIRVSKNRWGKEGEFMVNADLSVNRFRDADLNEAAFFEE